MYRHRLFEGVPKSFSIKLAFAIFSIVFTSLPSQVNATEEFFRQTKQGFSPSPYIQPDLTSGAMTYSLPILLPQGRNGLTPQLSFSYSSANTDPDNLLGYGWVLNTPYIKRLNKIGIDKLFNQDTLNSFFYSSLSGELISVTTPSPSSYFLSSTSTATSTLPYLTSLTDVFAIGTTSSQSVIDLTATSTVSQAIGVSADPLIVEVSSLSPSIFPDAPVDVINHKVTRMEFFQPNGEPVIFGGVPTEITGERTLKSKTFFYGVRDGKPDIRSRFYAAPVHYRDAHSGELRDIDLTLATTSEGFAMTQSSYNVALDTSGARHLMTMEHQGTVFSVEMALSPCS